MAITQAATGQPATGPFTGRIASVIGSLNLNSGTYSLAWRVRWNTAVTTNDQTGPGIYIASNKRGMWFQRRNGDPSTVITCYRFNGTATFNTASITGAYGSTTAWVHLCATYDGATIRTYVDGVANGTAASLPSLIATGNMDAIGIGGPMTGETADIVLFNRALTAAEVNQLAKKRNPTFARSGDLLGWWPTYDPTSLSNAGIDYSPTGNPCGLQASGANNPSASHTAVPCAFQQMQPRMIYVGPTVLQATAAGLTACSGAATGSPSGTAVGNTQCTGSAPPTLNTKATGLTNCTGAAVPAAGAVATGLTQTTGSALGSPSGRAVGTTNVTGSATGSPSGSAVGTTQVTGAAAPTIGAQAAGLTQSTGAAAPTLSTHADGLTQTTGTASAPGGSSATGLTQCTGVASASQVSGSCAGSTQCTGVATASLIYAATAAGLTACTGAAGTYSVATTATGLTQCTGAASGSSSGGGGGTAFGKLQPDNRRMWDVIGRRRNR